MGSFQRIIAEKKKQLKKRMASSTPVNSYEQKLQELQNMPREERVARIFAAMTKTFKIPTRFKEKTFSNYQPYEKNKKAFEKVQEYAYTFADRYKNGDWLILAGGYGLGKTHLALACARKCMEYFAKQYVKKNPNALYYSGPAKIIFRTSSELIQEIRDSYDSDNINEQEVMSKFKTIPLLIIDDLGTEKASEWQHEKMFNILDYRYREMLPTIITTNLSTGGLKEQVSERVVERMLEAAGNGKYLWKLQGESYRQKGE